MKKMNARKRKMMLVLPLLVIPFLTLAFYALGGGSRSTEKAITGNGLNLKLPDANLQEDKLMDKLGFYDKADKDSAKLNEYMRSDPYYTERSDTVAPAVPNELEQLTQSTASKHNQRLNVSPYEKGTTKPEDQVMQKLQLLQQELNKHTTITKQPEEVESYPSNPELSNDVDRLENMMTMMNSGNSEDPEINQLSTVMDKILDIQHPARIRERMKEKSLQNRQQVFGVSNSSGNDTIVKGFYGVTEDVASTEQNAIEAVVHENQVLVNGAVVKFRLLNDIYVNGRMIPKGTFVFGMAALEGERLIIEIESIRYANNLYTVKLAVYDMDGLPGIYIPGAISRDVAKQSADNSLSIMELSTMDPSLKGQATAAGINTAKSLLSRKVKLVKVLVKAGYKVFLKDKNVNP